MADDVLFACCERVLSVAVDALDDPPTRQMVTDREPTDNCPHVAVWLRDLGSAVLSSARGGQQPGMPTHRTSQPTATITVQVMSTACYPVFDGADLPQPDAITTATESVLIDRMDLWSKLREEATDGTLFAGILAHGKDGVEVLAPQTVSPQSGGGMAGTRLDVRFHLLRHQSSGS